MDPPERFTVLVYRSKKPGRPIREWLIDHDELKTAGAGDWI
jgi:hypothetical protein